MTTTDYAADLAQFDIEIGVAKTPDAAFTALQTLARAIVGAKLFTVMQVDMAADLSRRAYSSDPVAYPVSGTKPINYGPWFDIVHKQRAYFVRNTLAEISQYLFDFELIGSLGCGSIVNVPIIVGDELIATMNLLDEEQYYTRERVALIERYLSVPAKLAALVALRVKAN